MRYASKEERQVARKRLRRYEIIEREDRVGQQAFEAAHVLDQVARRNDFIKFESREELLVKLGDILASVRQAKEIIDRLCWRRVPARRRVIGQED